MNESHHAIRPETPADYEAVEALTREAFWNVYRPGCMEHYILHTFRRRENFVPELAFVLEKDGEVIGHIMYARAELEREDGTALPVMTFGPISIAPKYQRQGCGKKLLDYSMEKAVAMGVGALCIEGNIHFYGKSGFVVGSTKNIHYHGEPKGAVVPYFLVKELKPGFLDGVEATYRTPPGYEVDEQEVERFDARFPPKEKLKLPGQLV